MKELQIVVPMAGRGQRFVDAGYENPKPFIDVLGKPMIEYVIDNFNSDTHPCHFIFICQKSHIETYEFEKFLNTKKIKHTIVTIDKITEGAACSVLKARKIINNDNPLLIVNSDQYIENEISDFYKFCFSNELDGAIMTFHATSSKWSYVRLNETGKIMLVKEKEPISNIATAGIYFFKTGEDFVQGADEMIHKDVRTNGEFYVCPVYNELFRMKDYDVFEYPIPVQNMWGLGTPEDLSKFINAKRNKEYGC